MEAAPDWLGARVGLLLLELYAQALSGRVADDDYHPPALVPRLNRVLEYLQRPHLFNSATSVPCLFADHLRSVNRPASASSGISTDAAAGPASASAAPQASAPHGDSNGVGEPNASHPSSSAGADASSSGALTEQQQQQHHQRQHVALFQARFHLLRSRLVLFIGLVSGRLGKAADSRTAGFADFVPDLPPAELGAGTFLQEARRELLWAREWYDYAAADHQPADTALHALLRAPQAASDVGYVSFLSEQLDSHEASNYPPSLLLAWAHLEACEGHGDTALKITSLVEGAAAFPTSSSKPSRSNVLPSTAMGKTALLASAITPDLGVIGAKGTMGAIQTSMGRPYTAAFAASSALGRVAAHAGVEATTDNPFASNPSHCVVSTDATGATVPVPGLASQGDGIAPSGCTDTHAPGIAYNLGVALLQAGKPNEAFAALHAAVKSYRTRPRLWLRIAEACILAHEQAVARRVRDASARVVPIANTAATSNSKPLPTLEPEPADGSQESTATDETAQAVALLGLTSGGSPKAGADVATNGGVVAGADLSLAAGLVVAEAGHGPLHRYLLASGSIYDEEWEWDGAGRVAGSSSGRMPRFGTVTDAPDAEASNAAANEASDAEDDGSGFIATDGDQPPTMSLKYALTCLYTVLALLPSGV